jgi:formamidopyrimidine-DNA glycosylase
LPELPEVEITRRHLDEAMRGRRLVEVAVKHERTARHNASSTEVCTLLTGRTVREVSRKGKFLIAPLDDGHTLVAHLGMSGRFSVDNADEPVVDHTHFVARLDDGSEVRFVDPRTFGFVAVYDEDEIGRSGVSRLGPDAWTEPPAATQLMGSLAGRKAPIKALLLDQRPLAGLGNIYADEVLHHSGIHPLRPGGDLDERDVGLLLEATRAVLAKALESGGTTLDDLAYLLPDGQAGENLSNLAVYGREGLPCPGCGTAIERTVVRARSTHFCPKCQR